MFNSIISSTDSMISAGTSLASMGVAVVLGVLISVCYMFTQKKGSYTKDYIVAVAVLPVIVSLVIMLVGNSVARAFSLAGAFALSDSGVHREVPKILRSCFLLWQQDWHADSDILCSERWQRLSYVLCL